MGNAYKAYIYQYAHKLTKNANFNIKYCDFTVPGQTGADREVISNLIWTF
ncbi:hypothetical protein SBF1_7950002 [Candidatus Desulfosporosinus infrequens]|uniref:Uncharacterized protein n=1 Tax=Candidatus Desulfosporosinus infrequens TaxID=2043169 RepID=A0A2U3LS41_9FIRM|nr:hypothetical protein SBF1_7950002 [Candidatus Desulfosporosinus infrequens]